MEEEGSPEDAGNAKEEGHPEEVRPGVGAHHHSGEEHGKSQRVKGDGEVQRDAAAEDLVHRIGQLLFLANFLRNLFGNFFLPFISVKIWFGKACLEETLHRGLTLVGYHGIISVVVE